MTDLTAIDVLMNPDEAALEHARRYNARMRESKPDGFHLDDQHQPHVSILQRYVRTADLDPFYEAVGKLIAETDLSAIGLPADRIAHLDLGQGIAEAAIALRPDSAVLDFQAKLIDAAKPFVESGGTSAAFATDPGEPDISQPILDFVERFIPEHSGANFIPHITVGVAKLSDLKSIEAEPVDDFTVHAAEVSVYKLGQGGTARTELKAWET